MEEMNTEIDLGIIYEMNKAGPLIVELFIRLMKTKINDWREEEDNVDWNFIDPKMLELSFEFKIGTYTGNIVAEAAWYGDYPKVIQLV